tara:strand:- start:9 stop:284 length:276 start_codon:yes stop_codon:yes gene_type:complete
MSEENTELKRLILAYRAVFGREGHRDTAQELVWNDLVKKNRVMDAVFLRPTGGSYDVTQAALTEGMRQAILNIKKMLDADPDKLKKPNVKQ